jgi:hypothetical protein
VLARVGEVGGFFGTVLVHEFDVIGRGEVREEGREVGPCFRVGGEAKVTIVGNAGDK